jgi:acetolactate synthase-1/2/3 large subunit
MDHPSRTTAELIVECLENEGVTHVFGIPGEENIRLVDAHANCRFGSG